MLNLRVINSEGKDSLYKNVIKITYVGDYIHIYCMGIQYKELATDLQFFQIWSEK